MVFKQMSYNYSPHIHIWVVHVLAIWHSMVIFPLSHGMVIQESFFPSIPSGGDGSFEVLGLP
jgi:hypothetical protein